ncbi:MAG: hypothetical protein KAR11_04865 [Phycisphaerae bacterium]|nr:hypothetical protein [Phycisphaerae bacterium]
MKLERDILASGFQIIGRCMIVLLMLQCVLIRQTGYIPWSYITTGLLITWIVWMVGGIIWKTNRVPGNQVYVFILSLAGVFTWHLIADQYIPRVSKSGLLGSVNMSMLFHLVLLALSVLLSQCFFGYGAPPRRILDVIAGIIMGGTLAVTFRGYSEAINAPGVLCLCGVCIWLVGLTRRKRVTKVTTLFTEVRPFDRTRNIIRIAIPILVVATLLVATSGKEIIWIAAAGCLPVLAYLIRRKKSALLARGIIVFGVVATVVTGLIMAMADGIPVSAFGMGEKGFCYVSAGGSGFSLITATTGFVGMSCFAIGTVGLALWSLFRARYASGGGSLRATLWVAAVLFSTVALLVPGGYVNPVNVIVFGFVWGLLPRMTGVTPKFRPAWIPGLAVMCVVISAGVVANSGLLIKMSMLHQWRDKCLHLFGGMVLGVLLSWWLGSRRRWLGVVGLVVAVLIGGAGELGQKLFTTRAFEWADWKFHAMGVAIAALLYTIAMGCCLVMTPQRKLYWPKSDFALCAGWFSRLLLLSMTVGIIMFWLVGMLLSITTVWKNPEPTFLVSDRVALESKKSISLAGITNYSVAGKINTLMSTPSGSDNPLMAGQSNRRALQVFPRLGEVTSGFYRVSIQGTPFGPFAYDKQQASALVVASFEGICLLNARDVLRWSKDSPQQLREMIGLLQHRGKIVFVHPGTAADYAPTRDALLQLFPKIPCVCNLTLESGTNRTLSSLSGSLRWKKRPVGKVPMLITISTDADFIKAVHRYFDFGGKKLVTSITVDASVPATRPTTRPVGLLSQQRFANLSDVIKSLQD